MKVRIVKIYEDQNDPAFIFIEADIFKSKHQPIPDERIINRLQKKDAYASSSPAKTLKNNNLIIPIEQDELIIDENIDLSDFPMHLLSTSLKNKIIFVKLVNCNIFSPLGNPITLF